MEHYQVILAYDGSHFKGFQRQAKVRSVQGVVEGALRKLNWQGKTILAAGRTDTGAHATGQVIAFDLQWNHDLGDLLKALNSYLPSDVVAKEVKRVCPSFHPRYDAGWRKYYYRIYCQPVREPLLEAYAWRVWPAVRLADLKAVAQPLIGNHDFGAFGTSPISGGSTIRTVLESDWKQDAPYLTYQIAAHAFLYHMVRRVVFMQVKVAQGGLELDEIRSALEQELNDSGSRAVGRKPSNHQVHGLAPAQGLILVEVYYPPETFKLGEDLE